jgi:Raf kinase inhibitor-like YbhB/YbcL family protein
MRRISVRAAAVLAQAALAAAITACGSAGTSTGSAGTSTGGAGRSSGSGSPSARTVLGLSSPAFLNGSSIPRRYTCDGEDVSPPLAWTRVPARARSLALLVEDRDAPGGTFVHWSVYDLVRGSSGLDAGRVPPGGAEGENSFGRPGYGGPCPPPGDPAHRYVFSLYALGEEPGLPPGANPATVRAAIAGHTIAAGTLTGLYRR